MHRSINMYSRTMSCEFCSSTDLVPIERSVCFKCALSKCTWRSDITESYTMPSIDCLNQCLYEDVICRHEGVSYDDVSETDRTSARGRVLKVLGDKRRFVGCDIDENPNPIFLVIPEQASEVISDGIFSVSECALCVRTQYGLACEEEPHVCFDCSFKRVGWHYWLAETTPYPCLNCLIHGSRLCTDEEWSKDTVTRCSNCDGDPESIHYGQTTEEERKEGLAAVLRYLRKY